MDFKGQQLSEQLSMTIVAFFGAAAFLIGYVLQSFSLMLSIFGSGVGLAFLIAVPDWPWFKRHPLAWLPARNGGKGGGGSSKRKQPLAKASNLWGFL